MSGQRTTSDEEPNTSWPSRSSAMKLFGVGGEQRALPLGDALAHAAARDRLDLVVLRAGPGRRLIALWMPGVSIGGGSWPSSAVGGGVEERSRPAPSRPNTSPGLVQNCPAPIVSEPTNSRPIASARAARAAGRR